MLLRIFLESDERIFNDKKDILIWRSDHLTSIGILDVVMKYVHLGDVYIVQEDVQMVPYLELNFWGSAGLLGHYPIQWTIRYMLVNYVDCFSKNPNKMRIFPQSQRNHIWDWNEFNKSILTTLS